jgi:hypothetical protein
MTLIIIAQTDGALGVSCSARNVPAPLAVGFEGAGPIYIIAPGLRSTQSEEGIDRIIRKAMLILIE